MKKPLMNTEISNSNQEDAYIQSDFMDEWAKDNVWDKEFSNHSQRATEPFITTTGVKAIIQDSDKTPSVNRLSKDFFSEGANAQQGCGRKWCASCEEYDGDCEYALPCGTPMLILNGKQTYWLCPVCNEKQEKNNERIF